MFFSGKSYCRCLSFPLFVLDALSNDQSYPDMELRCSRTTQLYPERHQVPSEVITDCTVAVLLATKATKHFEVIAHYILNSTK